MTIFFNQVNYYSSDPLYIIQLCTEACKHAPDEMQPNILEYLANTYKTCSDYDNAYCIYHKCAEKVRLS
jgi:hypothetical protein